MEKKDQERLGSSDAKFFGRARRIKCDMQNEKKRRQREREREREREQE